MMQLAKPRLREQYGNENRRKPTLREVWRLWLKAVMAKMARKSGGPQEDRTPDLCVANADLYAVFAQCFSDLSPHAGTIREWAGLGICLCAGITTACGGNSPLGPTAPSPTSVDLLQFVIGDASTWPRQGSQLQNQIVDMSRREVCWVKYGVSSMFECWRWDDQWIYHEVDHALDGAKAGDSYTFTDARWLPRHLAPGEVWTLDVSANRVRWFLPNCVETAPGAVEGMPSTGVFPYRLRASIQPARNVGDLGVRDILTLDYEPYAPGQPGASERFSFAKGAGWFQWESARGTATFDQRGGPMVARSAACGE